MPGVVVPDVNASANDGLVGKVLERYGPQLDRMLDKVTAIRSAIRRRPT
jgi:hypothetical protein